MLCTAASEYDALQVEFQALQRDGNANDDVTVELRQENVNLRAHYERLLKSQRDDLLKDLSVQEEKAAQEKEAALGRQHATIRALDAETDLLKQQIEILARNSNTEPLRNLQAQFKDLESKYKSEVDKNKNLTEEIKALQEAKDRDYEEYELASATSNPNS